MAVSRLVNVPHPKDTREITPVVEGEHIYIVAAGKGQKWRGGDAVSMTQAYIGDHMLSRPEDLRRMYAADLAAVIRMARDAGYAQAMGDIRTLIGVKDS